MEESEMNEKEQATTLTKAKLEALGIVTENLEIEE